MFARTSRVRRPGDVLRGGSWNNNVENASALARNRNWNNNRNDNYGFRLVAVAVHFLPSLLWRGRAHAPRGRPALHSRSGSGNVGSPRTSGPPTEVKEKKGAGLAWSARSRSGTGAPLASGAYRSRGRHRAPAPKQSLSLRVTHPAAAGCTRARNSQFVMLSGSVPCVALRRESSEASVRREFLGSGSTTEGTVRRVISEASPADRPKRCFAGRASLSILCGQPAQHDSLPITRRTSA
jgi:hypothetical protein